MSDAASYLESLDQLGRPARNVTYRKTGVVNQGNTLDFAIWYTNHGEFVLVQDNALAIGTVSPTRVLDMMTRFDGGRRVTSRDEGHLTFPAPPGTPSITSNPRNNQTMTRDLLGRITRDLVDLDANGVGRGGPPTPLRAASTNPIAALLRSGVLAYGPARPA